MKINILGTDYEIKFKDYEEDAYFKKHGASGYCNAFGKEICVCNMSTYPGYENEKGEDQRVVENETLRHEIIHAFLNESGLKGSSGVTNYGWAENEEMIDWIALQFPKILKVFQEVKAL